MVIYSGHECVFALVKILYHICQKGSSVQLLSHVQLFATPWTAALQAFLSITNARSSKLMSIASMMPSNHLILCPPLLLLPSIFPSIRVFSNESALCIRWTKYWSFSFNISPSNRADKPRHKKANTTWFLLYEVPTVVKFTETESRTVVARRCGEGEMGLREYGKVKIIPNMNGGKGCTAMWMLKPFKKQKPFNCTFKMVKMVNFTLCAFYHNLRKTFNGGENHRQ